jgi:hypothetical protein
MYIRRILMPSMSATGSFLAASRASLESHFTLDEDEVAEVSGGEKEELSGDGEKETFARREKFDAQADVVEAFRAPGKIGPGFLLPILGVTWA